MKYNTFAGLDDLLKIKTSVNAILFLLSYCGHLKNEVDLNKVKENETLLQIAKSEIKLWCEAVFYREEKRKNLSIIQYRIINFINLYI